MPDGKENEMDDDGKTFDEWFSEQGFSFEHRAILALAWNAALESAQCEIDDPQNLEKLKA